ncbi:hypothetical protein [Microbispora sp. CA-102843]|uniref:hypothetical protein n=1 Tax=Microbispora sp. CA-102843 TaxID=3239952 RepID=UPI003D94778F
MMFRWAPPEDVPQPIEDVNGEPNLTKLDLAAEAYYRDGNLPSGMIFSGGQGVRVTPDVWFICVRVERVNQDPEWFIYPYASSEIPGWTGTNPAFDVPPPSAEDIARGLAAQGHTVFLRKYSGFATTYSKTAQTITL